MHNKDQSEKSYWSRCIYFNHFFSHFNKLCASKIINFIRFSKRCIILLWLSYARNLGIFSNFSQKLEFNQFYQLSINYFDIIPVTVYVVPRHWPSYCGTGAESIGTCSSCNQNFLFCFSFRINRATCFRHKTHEILVSVRSQLFCI